MGSRILSGSIRRVTKTGFRPFIVDGKGAVQLIVKPHGSSGTADPLDQRATVGAKVTAYTAAILNDHWLVRIEHTVS